MNDDAPRSPAPRWARRCLTAIIFIYVGIGLLHNNHLISTMDDNASYIYLAESIAGAHGYRDLYLEKAPTHALYPPMVSLLLTPVVLVFGVAISKLKLVILICGCLALWFIYRLIEEDAGHVVALSVAALTATLPQLMTYSTSVMSEVPFLLFSTLALYYSRKFLNDRDAVRGALVAGWLALAAAFFTRSIGVALLAGIGAQWLFQRRTRVDFRRAAMLIGPPSILVVAWLASKRIYLKVVSSYVDSEQSTAFFGGATSLPDRLIQSAKYYARAVPEFFTNSQSSIAAQLPEPYSSTFAEIGAGLSLVVGSVICVLIAIGVCCRLRQGDSLFVWYMAAYLGIVAMWPWQMVRFFVPLTPWLFWLALIGATAVSRSLVEARGRSIRRGLPYWSLAAFLCLATLGVLAKSSTTPAILGRWSLDAFAALVAYVLLAAVSIGLVFKRVPEQPSSSGGRSRTGKFVISIVVLFSVWNGIHLLTPPWGVTYGPEYQSYYAAMMYLRDHTPDDATVVGRKPRSIYVWSRRQTYGDGPRSKDAQTVLRYWRQHEVDYVVTGHVVSGEQRDAKHVFPAIELAGDKIEEVFRDGDARVFKIHKPL